MVARRIEVDPTGEAARILREADAGPIVFVIDGDEYHVARDDPFGDPTEEELWAGYDPDLVLKGLEAAAGAWSHLDTDEMIDAIYRWREEGSRPADRP